MQAELCGVTLHYEQYGQGDRHVLMLHGWGCEIKHFAPIADSLQSDYHITVIDFPGPRAIHPAAPALGRSGFCRVRKGPDPAIEHRPVRYHRPFLRRARGAVSGG